MPRPPVLAASATLAAFAIAPFTAPAAAQSLRGSERSMDRQHNVALDRDYTFVRSTPQLKRFVSLGLLVRIPESAHVTLHGVSYPYARPPVRTFVARLGAQYHAACGEPMVVTSLTRPEDRQPRNASDESVHPAGMAVDLRASNNQRCRTWLARVLLSLEKQGVIEATREHRPSHYHIAVFPTAYSAYVTELRRAAEAAAENQDGDEPDLSGPSADDAGDTIRYRVRRGDSLWEIARRYGTSVDELQEMNNLQGAKIVIGAVLVVPTSGR